jgi:hypothetical protein
MLKIKNFNLHNHSDAIFYNRKITTDKIIIPPARLAVVTQHDLMVTDKEAIHVFDRS